MGGTDVPVDAAATPNAEGAAAATPADDKDKRVKIHVEGEDETGEMAEMRRKKMRRFQLPPELPRWWQAKIIQYALSEGRTPSWHPADPVAATFALSGSPGRAMYRLEWLRQLVQYTRKALEELNRPTSISTNKL